MIDSNVKYRKLGVFVDTHKKVQLITKQNGMRISDYIKFLINADFKKHGFSDSDLENMEIKNE
jgi:hypothetical protein